jgi:hypothetical protein
MVPWGSRDWKVLGGSIGIVIAISHPSIYCKLTSPSKNQFSLSFAIKLSVL